jgi:hypothetical protein
MIRTTRIGKASQRPTVISNAESRVVAPLEAYFGSKLRHDAPIIDENFVAKFAAFVRASGGFSIW